MSSKFIHVIIYDGISIFLCVNNIPLHCIFHPSSHVWMWELDRKEGRASKNGCFELWCRRRLLKAPWTARGSIQLILKEINPEYSLEGLMLKLQYFSYLMRRAGSLKRLWCWERLKAGGEEGDRGWDGQMASLSLWIWVWANSGRQWRTGKPEVLQSMGSQRAGHDWGTEQQEDLWRVQGHHTDARSRPSSWSSPVAPKTT